ncbi:MAG: efflux RND transporter periplasmic adaptor subunit [bacterium]|nr:efflux RND transporter periplasmic adaptor subunit [bacterium]
MRKWLLIGAVGAAIVVGVLILPMLSGSQGGAVGAQEVTTAQVERTDLNTSIESSGSIAPAQSVTLGFGTSGVVSAVNVDVGDVVAAGDVLAQLETSQIEYQIQLQEQALIVQQNNYDALTAPPTAEQLAQAQASLTSAQSQLLQAQNALASAPNSTTINCADVTTREVTLLDAQEAWDDYVNAGYEQDATFLPDPDSTQGEALDDAQRAYDVAVAQCNNITPSNEYETQVASAQASVDQAQAALDALLAGPTETEIAAAEAQLEQARLELENARTSLEDAQITAPFAGIVAEVDLEVGETAATNAGVLRIVDTSTLHVEVDIDEVDIAQVQVGQAARITPEALEGVVLEGTVVRIAPAGSSENGIVTFSVRIDLTNPTEETIYVGMTTDVEIITGSEAGVLVVPTDAIQREGTTEFIEVLNGDNTTRRVTVTTGTSLDGLTVINGDVEAGDTVVVPQRTDSTAPGGFPSPFGG